MIKRRSKTDTLIRFCGKAKDLFGTWHITKEQAESAKLVFYWTGVPCANGHLTYRYVSTDMCRGCSNKNNSLRVFGNVHEGLDLKNSIDDLEYQLELKRLDKEYDYDI